MYEVANLLIKADLLGLKNADINYDVCQAVKLELDKIDVNHPSIYEYLNNNTNYYGLFQIESGLTKQVVVDVKPKNIDQLAVCVAISRPGAFAHIDKYVKYLREGVLEPIYPPIDNILKETGNVLIYQEQINKICQEVYGMSAIDADNIRYCVGKKRKDLMAKWEPVLYEKGKEKGIPESVTKYFWDTCNNSANYLFVAAHCYSYSYMAAINTYLKANHPQEFYVALLKMAKHEPNTLEVIGQIEMELRERGIQLLQPNLIKSDLDFTIEGKGIRFGLGSIKGIAGKNIEKLIQFRKPYSNKFELLEAARQAKIPSNILGALIMSGCLDEIVANRPKVLAEAAMWWILSAKEKQLCLSLGAEYNFDLFALFKFLKTANNGEGKPYIKPSRLETIRKHFEPHQNLYLENKKVAELTAYVFEKSLLGYSYSTTLKNVYSKACKELISIGDIKYLEEKDSVIVIGEVIESKTGKSQKGSRYWKGEITDETGTFGVMIFNDKMQDSFEINGCHPKEGDILFVRGQKFDTKIFANEISIQDQQVATSIRKLKDISGTKSEE
jgi:DNA polymerase III alpha subunit